MDFYFVYMEVGMSYVKAAYFDLASCNDEFKKGIEYLEQCSINEAIDCFQKACDQGSPSRQLVYKYHSYYGLSLLLSGNDNAIQICRNMFDSTLPSYMADLAKAAG